MKTILMSGMKAVVGVVAALAFSVASAIPIGGSNGTEGIGSFEGTLTYNSVDATHGTLTITLKNTSPGDNGGYITAIAFNNPFDWISSISSFSSTDTDFSASLCNNCVSGSPYGNFDFLTSTGGGFLGSGSPTKGIKPGALGGGTETFTYNLTGTNMTQLTSQNFLTTLSSGGDPKSFVVRMRGFNDGRSDKIPGGEVPFETPEPGTIAVFALGLGLMGRRLAQRPKH